jgi:hypothetical protein
MIFFPKIFFFRKFKIEQCNFFQNKIFLSYFFFKPATGLVLEKVHDEVVVAVAGRGVREDDGVVVDKVQVVGEAQPVAGDAPLRGHKQFSGF